MSRIHLYAPLACLILLLGTCSNRPVPPAPALLESDDAALSAHVEGLYEGVYEGEGEDKLPAPPPPPQSVEEEVMPVDPNQLAQEDRATLTALGWDERVGDGPGIWVNVERQELTLLQSGAPPWTVPCATATNGTGSVAGSEKTPLGWHVVSEKFGDGAVWGQVFRSRGATHEVWQPGGDVDEDLVLTRILWLEGLEPGKNQGKDADGTTVDSKKRYIYIHGTNGESVIGTPSSHGCVRMLNDDVIALFDRVPVGTPVLITENGAT